MCTMYTPTWEIALYHGRQQDLRALASGNATLSHFLPFQKATLLIIPYILQRTQHPKILFYHTTH